MIIKCSVHSIVWICLNSYTGLLFSSILFLLNSSYELCVSMVWNQYAFWCSILILLETHEKFKRTPYHSVVQHVGFEMLCCKFYDQFVIVCVFSYVTILVIGIKHFTVSLFLFVPVLSNCGTEIHVLISRSYGISKGFSNVEVWAPCLFSAYLS